jgi:peptidoglycan hydrolase-like protein with peptidoglycan-binding domain
MTEEEEFRLVPVVTPPPAAPYRPLAYGASGEDVMGLQTRLTELRYYHGLISGNYLDGTTSAIGSFQERNGLTRTGDADIPTQALLFSAAALGKEDPAPAVPAEWAEPAGDEDIVVTGDGEEVDFEALNKDYRKKLQRGSTGTLVKDVQNRLTELGFYTGPVSGNYMNQTTEAIRQFQKYNGLTVDGVTGQETWNALFNNALVVDARSTPRPTPAPTPIPYAMTVDVNNQVVTVFGLDGDGQHTRIVRQMICSTGKKATPSDVGDWVLDGRTARWCYFPAYGSHAQYWTRINKSIAFHSVIYNKVDTMALSVASYNALGSRASHGCIRLLVDDARWVYEHIGKGTVVTITEKLPSDEELNRALRPPPLNRRNMLPQVTPEPTSPPLYVSGGLPPAISGTLNTGSEGAAVFWLQMKLKELGYYPGSVTGGYYSGTKEAVKAFQKASGLKADGAAGKDTLSKLYENELATPTPEPTPAPTPIVIPTPFDDD